MKFKTRTTLDLEEDEYFTVVVGGRDLFVTHVYVDEDNGLPAGKIWVVGFRQFKNGRRSQGTLHLLTVAELPETIRAIYEEEVYRLQVAAGSR